MKNEQELRELFGWKIFGRVIPFDCFSFNLSPSSFKIETTQLIDKGGTYQILTTFKKPLGDKHVAYEEPPMPVRKPQTKHRTKKRTRARTPPDLEYTRPIRQTPVEHRHAPEEDEEHEEEKQRKTPRIYIEEREVCSNNGKFVF